MVLDAVFLNTHHYNVRIKGKVEQYRETSSALPYVGDFIFTYCIEFKIGRKSVESACNINEFFSWTAQHCFSKQKKTKNKKQKQKKNKQKTEMQALKLPSCGRPSSIDLNQLRAIIEADTHKTIRSIFEEHSQVQHMRQIAPLPIQNMIPTKSKFWENLHHEVSSAFVRETLPGLQKNDRFEVSYKKRHGRLKALTQLIESISPVNPIQALWHSASRLIRAYL